MLLVGIDEIEPDMAAGVVIGHPRFRQTALVRPGAPLTPKVVARLRELGITKVWVDHDITRDLDLAVSSRLTAQEAIYEHLRKDLAGVSRRTITTANVRAYRDAMVGLVEAMTSEGVAGAAQQLASADSDLFSHCTRVAYLSIVVGLELADYVRTQRSRSDAGRHDTAAALGLAGALHDVGKIELGERAAGLHEVHVGEGDSDLEAYRGHLEATYEMVRGLDMPATARQAVLNHHQRFDGSGWPDLAVVTGGRKRGAQRGRDVHVFTRIVSAANVLDNLRRDREGAERPAVAALYDFASPRFDGWFDPTVRRALLRCVPAFEIGSLLRLSDGRRAAVVDQNRRAPCRPVVRLFESAGSAGPDDYETLDLSAHPDVHVTECAGAEVARWLFEPPAPPTAGRRVA